MAQRLESVGQSLAMAVLAAAMIEMRVGGYVAADPEGFIGLLSSSLNLEARREADRRVVLYRRT